MLELFSFQLHLFFFDKMMKFYRDIYYLFFSQIVVVCVVKIQLKYLQSIEIYFCEIFQTYVLNLCPLRQAEMITWGNLVLAKRDPGSTKEGSRLAEMKLFTCNRKI